MKRVQPLLLAILIIVSYTLSAQVIVNTDGSSAHASAMLDVKSTNKGFLPPGMTQAQRHAILSPATGLFVYQTNETPGYYYYTGANWIGITGIGPGSISNSSCIDYDGNAYPTITIGTQVWTAENLRVKHYRSGDPIPHVEKDTAWTNSTTGAFCWYNNAQSANEKYYGVLYNCYAVDDNRGLCPDGWHVPTDNEWITLANFLGGAFYAGGKMKFESDFWDYPNTDATNSSNFSAFPGGLRDYWGKFLFRGKDAYWWHASDNKNYYTYFSDVNWFDGQIINDIGVCQIGLSVRCVKD